MAVNWTIDVGNVITILAIVGGFAKLVWGQQKSAALRDQKIDILLFGTEGKPGLVGDVENLKEDSGYIFAHLGKLGFERRQHEERRHS